MLVEGEAEHRGAGELFHLLVELAGVLHLALAEIVFGEGEVRVGYVLGLGEVLDQAVEELTSLILLLDHLKKVGEAEEHLVHAVVLGIFGGRDVALDRFQGQLLRRLVVLLLLLLQACGLAAVLRLLGLEDLLIQATRLEGEVALLVGEELAEAEQIVRLLGIVLGRVVNQVQHVLDLPVGDLVDLVALLSHERIHGQRGPRLLVLFLGGFLRLGQLGLLTARNLDLLLLEFGLGTSRLGAIGSHREKGGERDIANEESITHHGCFLVPRWKSQISYCPAGAVVSLAGAAPSAGAGVVAGSVVPSVPGSSPPSAPDVAF